MPTGVGKSLVIAGLLDGIYHKYPSQRIMMLTHVKELIEQNFEKLLSMWPTAPAGIYSAGLNRKEIDNMITFAGIQSVVKKAALFGHIDLIVIDECHLVSNSNNTSYRKFIDELLKVNPYLKVIGLSATPYRLGVGMLTDGGLFTHICYDNTSMDGFNRLIKEGYIVPLVPKRTNYELDIAGLKKHGGEFVQKEMQDKFDKEEVTHNALLEAMELGHDRSHWLIFGTGVEHCDNIAAMLDLLGISAVSVHSKKPAKENDEAIAAFKAGRVRALVNNNKLTTGFDCPDIDMIIMLRPTDSPGLWVQMLGRGTRPVFAEGYDLGTIEGRLAAIEEGTKQNCLVLDFAGNTRRLGPINDPVIPRKKGKGGGGCAPVKLCENKLANGVVCNTICHARVTHCPCCGFEFPKNVKLFSRSDDAELIASSDPLVKMYHVDNITYALHRKSGRPDSILVSYFCGARKFNEFVCLEHNGYPGKYARDWWRDRCEWEPPETTKEALDYMDNIAVAKYIKVWVNKKYPEILVYDFEGPFEED